MIQKASSSKHVDSPGQPPRLHGGGTGPLVGHIARPRRRVAAPRPAAARRRRTWFRTRPRYIHICSTSGWDFKLGLRHIFIELYHVIEGPSDGLRRLPNPFCVKSAKLSGRHVWKPWRFMIQQKFPMKQLTFGSGITMYVPTLS